MFAVVTLFYLFRFRWLFGNVGCQFYAFMGFLFGSANIGTLALIALDRYAVTCRCEIREYTVT